MPSVFENALPTLSPSCHGIGSWAGFSWSPASIPVGLSDTFHSCLQRLELWTACHLPFLKKLVLLLQSLRPRILGYTYSRDADIRDLSQKATTTWERRTCQGERPAQFQGSRKHSSSTCSPWLEINSRSMSMKLNPSIVFSSPWNCSIRRCDNTSDVILTHKLQLSVISSFYR